MENKEEKIINKISNYPNKKIIEIMNVSFKNEKSIKNIKANNLLGSKHIDIDINTNINEEKNNSNFIFIKANDDDKDNDLLNYSYLSISKQSQNRFKSLSFDKRSNLNKNISFEKTKTPKKSIKGIFNIYKLINNDKNDSNDEIIPYDDNENTKIITTAKVRKLSVSSENSIKENICKLNTNKIDEDNKNKDYSPTRIDFVLNLKINNNIEKVYNEMKLISEKYIYKNESNNKEIKVLSTKNNNSLENNNQYQHNNFLNNKVSLDSIEELCEEENNSKTKSKNKTSSELNSYFVTEKNNSANSCININKNKINSPNSNNSNVNNIIYNTTCQSYKYNINKNNIFDISSDESENRNNYDNNKIINYIENSIEEQNNYDNNTNIFLRPLDTFINYNEYENTNSFMNESDINKLFYSPNKKFLSFIDNNSIINNNNCIEYNNKINNSAVHSRFNKYILNEENAYNYINNSHNIIFSKDNNREYYNKTYIKKSISKDVFSKPKINNLKKLISPENLNKYYSTSFNKNIKSNNNNKVKSNIETINISIKTFIKDKLISKKIQNIEFNERIDIINNIKNNGCIKYFNKNTSFIKKSLNDLNLLSITNIDKKRIYLISENNENSRLKTNKKDEYIDNTLSTTADKKNNNNLGVRSNESKEKNKNSNKKFIIRTNRYKIDNLKTKKIGNIPRINKFYLDDNKLRNMSDKNNLLLFNKSPSLNNSGNNSSFDKKVNKKLVNSFDKNSISIEDNIKNNINNKKHKLYISVESYEELIKDLLIKTNNIKNKLLSDLKDSIYDCNLICNESNKIHIKEMNNNILAFEEKLKFLKNNYLCLLIKKHFLKSKSDKEKIIKEINIINKRDIFNKEYIKITDEIIENLEYNKNIKILYLDKIIKILENYKDITKYEIKYTKKKYKENNKISPDNLDFKIKDEIQENNKLFGGLLNKDLNTKKIIISTTVILPFLYGINYLMSLYNQ